MKKFDNIRLPHNHTEEEFQKKLRALGIPEGAPWTLLKKSLDARHKSKIQWVYSIGVGVSEEKAPWETRKIPPPRFRPVIVGAGPAGIFVAYWLLQHGIQAILLEQGAPMKERVQKMALFMKKGVLDEKTNICFGAGGAGAYSDGKLLTRIKSDWIPFVMEVFIRFGGNPSIRYEANPHLGSNKIREVIEKILDWLKQAEVDIQYHTECVDLVLKNRKITGLVTSRGILETDTVFLATGHSKRAVYDILHKHEIAMQFKPFALGVRMEHPSALINQIQHGSFASDSKLGFATYKLVHTWEQLDRRSVYSFCMCPGGYILNSSTENGAVVCNGMSNSAKNGPFSNAGVVVNIDDKDVSGDPVFKGAEFQKQLERAFARAANPDGSSYRLPAMRLLDYLDRKPSKDLPPGSCPNPLIPAKLFEIFPPFVNKALSDGLKIFNQKMRGLFHPDAILVAIESRTSSPVRILRDQDTFESVNTKGLYPLAEGAGYAGGITSAAVDGINAVESYLQKCL